MKTLVIGLDCAAPELLFGDEQLTTFRRLMAAGCYGELESVNPPITVPAWMCMSTSRDPGSLGVYGFRNRPDHSYSEMEIVNSSSIRGMAIWDQVAVEGGQSVIAGVPPGYPPRKVNGTFVGCFMTPDTRRCTFTHPASAQAEIERIVHPYPVDVDGFRTSNKDWLKDQIYDMTRKHFKVLRHLLTEKPWDHFQFVEIGLDRMHHGFWKYHDPQHVLHEPGHPLQGVIREYYRYLDHEIGRLLELLDDECAVVVLSDHGAQRLDGGFCINEWLIREKLLSLNDYPDRVTPFSQLNVDWENTKVWSEGGYYARVFLNVKGREPSGCVDPADYEELRDSLKARLEATVDPHGRLLGTQVFRPEEVYREVRNVAPDLIVHFGGLFWRSVGGVGYPEVHVQENDTGPDDCNHAQYGGFILAAPRVPAAGRIEGVTLLDVAPTLLELGGYDIPQAMTGRSIASRPSETAPCPAVDPRDDQAIRDRLSGLGYIG